MQGKDSKAKEDDVRERALKSLNTERKENLDEKSGRAGKGGTAKGTVFHYVLRTM